jgi:hypothetical protein
VQNSRFGKLTLRSTVPDFIQAEIFGAYSPTYFTSLSTSAMQRPTYGQPAPAQSPPLHHPVPQHVSTVPQLRSPPPPVPQQTHSYGNPYQPQAPTGHGGVGNAFGAYGGFINDPTTQMGFQVSQAAIKHGQEYVEQNVSELDGQFNERMLTQRSLTVMLTSLR